MTGVEEIVRTLPSNDGFPWRDISDEFLLEAGVENGRSPSGNSGCDVGLVEYLGKVAVLKTTQQADYVCRLKKQAQKQREARRSSRLPYIRIPEIFDELTYRDSLGNLTYGFLMEYLNYHDYEDFFLRASLIKIDSFLGKLIQMLETQLEQSELKQVDNAIFLRKLDDVESRIKGRASARSKLRHLELIRKRVCSSQIILPIGAVHGDLTLSNMMISQDASVIGVFDFLDSYLDSPILDIAKVRQDTQFLWSRLMSSGKIDKARYEMIMAYLDIRVDAHFREYRWYRENYGLIQAINIARIFPYEKDERVSKFTCDSLSKLGY